MTKLQDALDSLRDTLATAHPARLAVHVLVMLLYAAASYLVGHDVGLLVVAVGVFFGVVAATSPDSQGPVIASGVIGFYTVGSRDDLVHPSTLVLALLLLAAHLACALLAVGPDPALWSRSLLVHWVRAAGALVGTTVAAYLLLVAAQTHPLPVGTGGLVVGIAILAAAAALALRVTRRG